MNSEDIEELYNWTPKSMLEIEFKKPDDFLKIKETLTRIGIASKRSKTLYQSCHILHKQSRYYITHFKEMFALDGKPSSISILDIERRNTIACLLQDWGLLTIVSKGIEKTPELISQIKIIPFADKDHWDLEAKYTIGQRR